MVTRNAASLSSLISFVFLRVVVFVLLLSVLSGCANVLSLSGGEKDILPPKIQKYTADLNINELHFVFNEHIQLNNWNENFYISPPLKSVVEKKVLGKKLILKYVDELNEEVTYLVSLSNCIKDLNEGNVANDLQFIFSKSESVDSLKLEGKILDAYSKKPIENSWILIYDSKNLESIPFGEPPKYVTKSNSAGKFIFSNLKNTHYQIFGLTGSNFTYEKGENIAFYNKAINLEIDSFITLNLFNPIIDSSDLEIFENSEIVTENDGDLENGSLLIKLNLKPPLIFQLVLEENKINDAFFKKSPYLISNIPPGEYKLRCIIDSNNDKKWTTGSLDLKQQPEKVIWYEKNILIRANWDLTIDWDLVVDSE